jgi:hypothetical protein
MKKRGNQETTLDHTVVQMVDVSPADKVLPGQSAELLHHGESHQTTQLVALTRVGGH